MGELKATAAHGESDDRRRKGVGRNIHNEDEGPQKKADNSFRGHIRTMTEMTVSSNTFSGRQAGTGDYEQ
jgi:hypothetical protein